MSKKPRKVEEGAGAYAAKKQKKAVAPHSKPSDGVRYMDDASFKKAANKVFKVHHELFRKLAQ